MATATATNRLRRDLQRLAADPLPGISAVPTEDNILEWHYAVRGSTDTPYEGGIYHGKLIFPADFPFRPPSIFMLTPSGRFKPNERLCLTISDYHPEQWNPGWSVSTILLGLQSFMNDDEPTAGAVHASATIRKRLARESKHFNLKSTIFCELFPEIATELRREVEEEKRVNGGSTSADTQPALTESEQAEYDEAVNGRNRRAVDGRRRLDIERQLARIRYEVEERPPRVRARRDADRAERPDLAALLLAGVGEPRVPADPLVDVGEPPRPVQPQPRQANAVEWLPIRNFELHRRQLPPLPPHHAAAYPAPVAVRPRAEVAPIGGPDPFEELLDDFMVLPGRAPVVLRPLALPLVPEQRDDREGRDAAARFYAADVPEARGGGGQQPRADNYRPALNLRAYPPPARRRLVDPVLPPTRRGDRPNLVNDEGFEPGAPKRERRRPTTPPVPQDGRVANRNGEEVQQEAQNDNNAADRPTTSRGQQQPQQRVLFEEDDVAELSDLDD